MNKSPKYYETLGRIKDGEMTIEYNCKKMDIIITDLFAKAMADTGTEEDKDIWSLPVKSISPEILQKLHTNITAQINRMLNLKRQNKDAEAEIEKLRSELSQYMSIYNQELTEKIS